MSEIRAIPQKPALPLAEWIQVTVSKLARRMAGIPIVLVWFLIVCTGMFGLVRYQMTPGAKGELVPRSWPVGAMITRSQHRLTLVMLLHPQCPCSRASIHELAQLMSRAGERIEAHVLFVEPPGAPADWSTGKLWNDARAVPNAIVSVDKAGHDAAIFGATTSGEVLVYDASGRMQFNGGITDGRGHEGDNAGYLAILALVEGDKATVSATPVYGCSLGVCRIAPDGRSKQ